MRRQLKTLKPHLFAPEEPKAAASISSGLLVKDGKASESEDDDDEIGHELQNKPVDRLKKLTRAEKNLKLMKRMRRDA